LTWKGNLFMDGSEAIMLLDSDMLKGSPES